MQLISNAAGQPMVSGQLTHMPGATQASFTSGGTPTITFNHYSGGAAGLDEATSSFLAQLPKGIRPQGPATREAAPKTVADFNASLWWWLQHSPSIRTPPELYDAWQLYVLATTQIATDHGLACARAYHADCIEALERRWWHPQTSGPRYTQAYTQHVPSPGKSPGQWNRAGGKAAKPAMTGFKRKATAPAQEAPETRSRRTCAVHPGATHTDAECLSQRDTRAPARARDAAGDPGRHGAARR
jgi:hypothetical protein